MTTSSQVGGNPMSARDPHWWHINGVPINMKKMWLMQTRWFSFLAGAFAPDLCDLIQSFSSVTTIVSMATRSSDLEDQTSGANLQTEGHADMPSQSQKDPEETGASVSSPSCSPSWSLARRPLPSHPNTRYCLGIHVTLTKETGVVPSLPHAWTAPLVEDMLCYARTGLTKAVVMVPGRAILLYGRQSLGEDLSLDKSRDSAFVLTGAGTWVCKPAYLAIDPLTIQEAQWEIAQAITECQIKVRGPGHPCVNPLSPQPFRFDHPEDSPQKDTPRDANSDHQLLPHWPLTGQNHN